jgi:hypothetical protein
MNNPLLRVAALFVLLSPILAPAGTLYVNLNSTNPTAPYSDWSTAATNIQDAIDASADGDQIWVTNGVYQLGGKVMAGNLTNRIALDKAVTVQSVNGPFVTTIAGIGATNNAVAVRCAWLTNNAALIGFTLTRGATRNSGDQASLESGGAVWCASSNALVSGCVIISNTAFFRAGGAYQGTLNNCFITSNSVPVNLLGGAAYSASLNNCTVASNSTVGLTACRATNSICYYNAGNNYSGGSFSYSCVTPAAAGTGNFTNAPIFFPDRMHLSLGSPGIGAGTTPVTSADIFGQTWSSPPSVGCAETGGLPYVFLPQVQSTNNPIGLTIKYSVFGDLPFSYTWLKDSAPLQDDGHFSGTQSPNLIATGVSFADAGGYQLVVSNNAGSVTSAVAQVVFHCVDSAGTNPVAPYTSWDTAATNIQDAIDAAVGGDFVFVTNGVYSSGGKVISGDLTNRVAIDKALIVKSVNGYMSTIIEGQWDAATTNGPGAVRCAWLTNGATLYGFTLRNGATRGGNFITIELQDGGGAWLSTNATISNCLLTNNSARYGGGGAVFGTVNNSFLIGNTVQIGTGGGAYQVRLNNCTIRENHTTHYPGGAGVDTCIARNCIIVENYESLFGNPDYSLLNYYGGSINKFTNCCTSPLPSAGSGNMDTNVLFLDAGFRLAPASPCRGAGSPLYAAGYDLDGEPFNNPPSMGCDEFIEADQMGPLSFDFLSPWTTTYLRYPTGFATAFNGRISRLEWSFGDGTVVTNGGYFASHTWAHTGTYLVMLTAYNLDHPTGVSSNFSIFVDTIVPPTITSPSAVNNSFQFTFMGQTNASYTLYYTTNLTQPVLWFLWKSVFSTGGPITMQDSIGTNAARFYHIQSYAY